MPTTRFVARQLVPGLAAMLVMVVAAVCVTTAGAAQLDEQRQLFTGVYKDVERGNWSVVDDLPLDQKRLLASYVLWPDLRAAFFRATLKKTDRDEVESFLAAHGVLRPARDLRYRYALHLAGAGDLDGFMKIYQSFYQGLENARLDCLALRAEIAAGRERRVVNRATELWMVGKSQVDECDPVFAFLEDNQLLGPIDYAKRFELAVDAREFSRARWLAKSIDQQHVDVANQWLSAQANPEAFVRKHMQRSSDESGLAQLVYAIERITYRDPERALELWQPLVKAQQFSSVDEYRTARHIALWTARDGLPGAYRLLTALPRAAQNTEVLRWRARSSLRDENWTNLLKDIAAMPVDESGSEEWRYWHAIALQRTGRRPEATALFGELAGERSYYGFLAADELSVAYALDDRQIDADEAVISALAARPELIRARELFFVGLDGRGRSEWDEVVSYLDPEQKVQAAKLADRWGWHSRAIAAAASVGEYDDLTLRYPLPYQRLFRQHAESASIATTWAYGIARSESLFMRDVRSSAGAIGLMQLMPATGRSVAKQLRLPFAGVDTLTDPQENIRLGTTYLGQMAERYGGNQVLATAAYNAGPHRVDRWLPESGDVDARIWIENIPFNETRKYVRRVLEAEAIFYWRITGQVRRLSDRLLLVQPNDQAQKVAQN